MVSAARPPAREAARAYLAVASGGALGAVGRYLVTLAVEGAPATFVANITGAFLLGFFATLGSRNLSLDVRRFITIGVLGSYTTFSTLSYETLRFLEAGDYLYAGANALGSLILGLVAAAVGARLARRK